MKTLAICLLCLVLFPAAAVAADYFREVVTVTNDVKISENFTLREFACSCCNQVMIDPELLRRLQAMRTEAGRPIIINSGYRCLSRNRAIGSQDTSQHRQGKAADIRIVGLSLAAQRALCEKHFGDGGIGYANTFTHVDVRGSRARWTY